MNSFLRDNRNKKLNTKKFQRYFWLLFSVAFLFSFIIYPLIFIRNASAAQLSNRSVTITDSRQSQDNVGYTFNWTGATSTLRCIEMLFCVYQTGACVTPAGLDTTGTSKGTWSGLTSALWNLDNSSNGLLSLTNSGGEAPSANVSLEFLGFTNPSSAATYNTRIATFSDDACSNPVDWGPVTFTIMGPGLSITATIPAPYATAVFQGRAYPSAFVTILRNGSVAGTDIADSDGDFSKTITGLPGGITTFTVWAEDTKGRRSPGLSFTVNLIEGVTTTISGIFLAPTIEINKTKLRRGEFLRYNGQAYASSGITIFVYSPVTKKTYATGGGKWQYSLDTSFLEMGDHTTRSRAQADGGAQSTFSYTLDFQLTHPCPGADLNNDGRVNLVDFSILLYWWGTNNECADQNEDGKVDLIDFSIMLFYWTG